MTNKTQTQGRQQEMRSKKIFGVLLVAIVAAIGLTASASANEYEGSGNAEPQTTNIPYTAWVGTQIRLAKCFDLEFERPTAL